MNYTPQPNTIPHKVMLALQAFRAKGALKVCEALVCEHIDQPTLIGKLQAYMDTAISHGAVIKTRDEGITYWALGDGVSVVDDDDAPKQLLTKAKVLPKIPRLADIVLGGAAWVPAKTEPWVTAEAKFIGARVDDDSFDASFNLDGSMHVQVGSDSIRLSPDNLRKFVGFIERLTGVVA